MIYLRYGNIGMSFRELVLFSTVKSNTISSISLRGFISEKVLNKRRQWHITISSDSIRQQSELLFLENWFLSADKSISLNNTDFRAVYVEGGDMPIEFLDNIRFLPEFSFIAISKSPDSSLLAGESMHG